jgi:hypothetical protein
VTARRYRKKPVVVEAMGPVTYDTAASIAHWCSGSVSSALDAVVIDTLEGTMIASLGDYVIRGVKGEFYPCKPDIFDATYEPEPDKENETDE